MKTVFRAALNAVTLAIVLSLAWLSGCCHQPISPKSACPCQPGAKTCACQPGSADCRCQSKLTPAAKPAAPVAAANPEGWKDLFNGQTLEGWKCTDFAGHGEVEAKDGQLLLGMGVMTGVNYTNPPPTMNYELSLEAMRVEGSDFFCGLTFQINQSPCTLIVGGWGGGLVGLSSIDDMDASENETSKFKSFENKKWYKIRLRVTERKVEVWIDDEKQIDVIHTGRKISLRAGEIESSAPFGIATWSTSGAYRNLKLRTLKLD
jgi:hypothetical protein